MSNNWLIEIIIFLQQNKTMKQLILSLIILFCISAMPIFAKSNEKNNINTGSFIDIGRYKETFEINEPDQSIAPETKQIDDSFEEEAIIDLANRYNNNAIELNLEDTSNSALDSINEGRIYKLHINETQYKIEQKIKAENMIWDESKSFSHAFLTNSRQMAPIPGIINSQSIGTSLSKSLNASLGQTFLNDAISTSVLFVRANESTYNTGSVISYKGDLFNLAIGSFNSSFNQAASGGAILSSSMLKLPKKTGSISFGGAYFANEEQDCNKTTGGLFGEYTYKRLKLNAQIGQSKYTNSLDCDTSVYFIPEFQISKSLTLKTRFIRNITRENNQDELVLTYKPFKNKNNLEIEFNASNQYNNSSTIKQRFKLSTSFRI